jgi:GT2 family glycosyltransferase
MFHLDVLLPYGQYRMSQWRLDSVRRVEVLKGACILSPRTALEQVGLLNEEYFMYSEELDLSFSLRKAGWQTYWLPQAVVVHHGGQSTQQAERAMFLRLYEGKVLYFRKHYGRAAGWVYKLILAVAAISRLALAPFALLERPDAREEHRTLAGYYRELLVALPGL